VFAAVGVIVAAGVVHGLWSGRWSDGREVRAAVERLHEVPLAVGDWQGREQPTDEGTAAYAGIAAYLRRFYLREAQNQGVLLILMVGPFGPLSVHTPDVCYSGAGYELFGQPVRHTLSVGGRPIELWTARFHKPGSPGTTPLRIFWGWNAGDGWKAPGWPRWTFRMAPVLFKMYLAREMARIDEPLDTDPCLAFLAEWLPQADPALFPGRGTPSGSETTKKELFRPTSPKGAPLAVERR
jgi:hypothetical protein